MICPHCKNHLSLDEIKTIKAAIMSEIGSIKSIAKAKASAENGKKGGRPRKIKMSVIK